MWVGIAIVAILALFAGLLVSRSAVFKYKQKVTIFDRLKNTKSKSKVFKTMCPSKSSNIYKKLKSQLENAFLNISVEDFYLIKYYFGVLLVIIATLVFLTNTQMNINTEIEKSKKELAPNSSITIYTLYTNSNNGLGVTKLVMMSKTKIYNTIHTNLYNNSNYNEKDLVRYSQAVLNLYLNIKNSASILNLLKLLCIMVALEFIPNAALKILVNIRKESFKQEVDQLKQLLILTGTTPDFTVEDMIKVLSRNAVLFKETMLEFKKHYLKDRLESFDFLEKSSNNPELVRIAITLRSCEYRNKKEALNNLELSENQRKKLRAPETARKTRSKDDICIMMLVVVLLVILANLVIPYLNSGVDINSFM